MSLLELWTTSSSQLEDKLVSQVIAFAGSGKLQDGGATSKEFREFLAQIPSSFLSRYADECLTTKFEGNGFALQDVINEVGNRLGFEVTAGRYRGLFGHIGFDGLWRSSEENAIIVEVKTTDAYSIDLDKIVEYRKQLIQLKQITEKDSSMLLIVGREDTGNLEAQIRGSRYAWDIRLISVDAILRLMKLKEELEDPAIMHKIRSILKPQEFTKVDSIIDIVFQTTEDVWKNEVNEEEQEAEEETIEEKAKTTPVKFNDACLERIKAYLKTTSLIKQSRITYMTPDGSLALVCAVSREYEKPGSHGYWFAFHPHQKEFLEKAREAYVAFGCGSEKQIVLIPFDDFIPWLNSLNTTNKDDRNYWHISIFKENDTLVLHPKKGYSKINLGRWLIA